MTLSSRLYRRAELDSLLTAVAVENSRVSIAALVSEALEHAGIGAARERFRVLFDTAPDPIRFGERELNSLGYELLNKKRIAEAVAVHPTGSPSASAYPATALSLSHNSSPSTCR